jgi:inward rectifier potassium channel
LIYKTPFEKFVEVYLHSAQTLTTVGYGRISPVGMAANLVSSFEALVGLMTFALITGLIYGRFSKPTPRIKFSEKAVFAPYKDGYALMFRLANLIESNLMNSRVRVSASISEPQNEIWQRSFYTLTLERDEIAFFPTSWTIVHPVTEESPFWDLTEEEIEKSNPEVFILFSSFDDTFDQTIHVRLSYSWDDILFGMKFSKMLSIGEDGVQETNLALISAVEPVSLPSFPKK